MKWVDYHTELLPVNHKAEVRVGEAALFIATEGIGAVHHPQNNHFRMLLRRMERHHTAGLSCSHVRSVRTYVVMESPLCLIGRSPLRHNLPLTAVSTWML